MLELRDSSGRGQGNGLWTDLLSVLFEAPGAIRDHADAESHATIFHFNRFLLSRSYIHRARFSRSETQARRDDLDHYVIHLVLQGEVFFTLGSGSIRLRPMEIGILDLSRDACMGCRHADSISLILPRTGLGAPERGQSLRHGRRLTRSSAVGKVLAQHLVTLAEEAPRLDERQATLLAEATQELVLTCLCVAASADPAPAPRTPSDPIGRVRLYIEHNLQRPDLGPDDIARDLGLSRSQLYRQFERYGGVGSYIRRRRLRRSFMEICNPRQSHRRIGEIAYSLGFEDEAHFSRIFRQTFGLSPRAARAAKTWPADMPGGSASFAQWVADLSIN